MYLDPKRPTTRLGREIARRQQLQRLWNRRDLFKGMRGIARHLKLDKQPRPWWSLMLRTH